MSLTNHAKRLRELAEIKFDMALVMGLGTYQDLWRSDAAALLAGAEALEAVGEVYSMVTRQLAEPRNSNDDQGALVNIASALESLHD
jgi:hypothetical protein